MPEDMLEAMARKGIMDSNIYLNEDGTTFGLYHEAFGDKLKKGGYSNVDGDVPPEFNILELIKECEGWWDDCQPLIKTLEEAVRLLKGFDADQNQDSFNWDKAPIIWEFNGYRWYLGPEADEEINWNGAIEWCQSVGGELPPRDILLQCYMNEDIKPLFKDGWYWSGTEFHATTAWVQSFYYGNQNNFTKTYLNYVRAVRKVKI